MLELWNLIMDYIVQAKSKKRRELEIMDEVNLLEGVLLSDEQIEILAFAIKPQDIKNYINEHKEEYRSWLFSEYFAEFNRKYNLITQDFISKMYESVKESYINLKLMLKK